MHSVGTAIIVTLGLYSDLSWIYGITFVIFFSNLCHFRLTYNQQWQQRFLLSVPWPCLVTRRTLKIRSTKVLQWLNIWIIVICNFQGNPNLTFLILCQCKRAWLIYQNFSYILHCLKIEIKIVSKLSRLHFSHLIWKKSNHIVTLLIA